MSTSIDQINSYVLTLVAEVVADTPEDAFVVGLSLRNLVVDVPGITDAATKTTVATMSDVPGARSFGLSLTAAFRGTWPEAKALCRQLEQVVLADEDVLFAETVDLRAASVPLDRDFFAALAPASENPSA